MTRKKGPHQFWLLLLALLLLAGMLLTLLFGRGSRHGYGALPSRQPLEHRVATQLPAPDSAVEIVDLGITTLRQVTRHP